MNKKEKSDVTYITRVALLEDGICVWFGTQPRHYEGNYYADKIRTIGEPDGSTPNSLWGKIRHLEEKSWWSSELQMQMYTEVRALIGNHGSIISSQ